MSKKRPPERRAPPSVLDTLDLHPLLRQRISVTSFAGTGSTVTGTGTGTNDPREMKRQRGGRGGAPPAEEGGENVPNDEASASASSTPSPSPAPRPSPFVLYLPTVLLRLEHNPAFALACRLANGRSCPLLVLATALDDTSVPPDRRVGSDFGGKAVVMTARRLSLYLEALGQCCSEWSDRGAAVYVRVHGPEGRRTPDHLTLAGRAELVVTDEPFVDPYLSYVRRVERACRAAGVGCFRVDGSTTVPPAFDLKRRFDAEIASGVKETFGDKPLPAKAYLWQKRTERLRMGHVRAAMEGCFDAPDLTVRIDGDDLLLSDAREEKLDLPPSWRDPTSSAPGVRPWTASDLTSVSDLKAWSMAWPGSDDSVPPCSQTVGTSDAGLERWKSWRGRGGMESYHRRRNDIRQPHASSRMSCYLNVGSVSIFRLVHEVKESQALAKASGTGGRSGADKFEEEIVKWREYSYAHCLGRPDDHATCGSLPDWSVRYLDGCSEGAGPDRNRMDAGRTGDEKWDAMQRYLVSTGELHNNARMTWGKTAVHWSKLWGAGGASGVVRALCFLNDRYALDGLSPPSYAGLLWCAGWTERPAAGGSVGRKDACNYKRSGAAGFCLAETRLLLACEGGGGTFAGGGGGSERRKIGSPDLTSTSSSHLEKNANRVNSRTISSYFGVQQLKKKDENIDDLKDKRTIG